MRALGRNARELGVARVKPPEKTAGAENAGTESSASNDVVLVHGVTRDGGGLAVIRKREDRLELGAVHPLKEGKSIHGEVVRLKPRAECPLVCDVEVCVPASSADHEPTKPLSASSSPARKGPAQVASARYRENWDVIWKRPNKPELPN
jgi:hypothetical protein